MGRFRIRSSEAWRGAAVKGLRGLLLGLCGGAVLSVLIALGLCSLPGRVQSQSALFYGLSSGDWQVSADQWGFGRRAYTLLLLKGPPGQPSLAALRGGVANGVEDLIRADPRDEHRRLRVPAWARFPLGPEEAGITWSAAVSGWPFPCLRGVELTVGVRGAVPVSSVTGWPQGYVPLAPWWPGLLADAALFAVPVLVAPVMWRGVRSRRRRARNQCPRCGYDLRASPGRCPECGGAGRASGAA